MNLVDHQRALLGLIVTDPERPSTDDSYIAAVAGSTPLAVIRDIGDSWRRFSLQRLCPLSWRLAVQTGTLGAQCERFGRRRDLSPFLQILGRQFLDELAAGDDPAAAALARFERALIDSTLVVADDAAAADDDPAGETGELVIDWPCDPEELLTCLVEDRPIGTPRTGRYRTRASAATPAAFTIQQL